MSDAPSQLMIAAEVARWLRMSCSTTYMWAATGKLPSLKLHGSIRFVRADIERWIRDRSRMPDDSAPLVTRPILSPNPTAVSRVMIQRAGDRAIRQISNRQRLRRRASPLSAADVYAQKDRP